MHRHLSEVDQYVKNIYMYRKTYTWVRFAVLHPSVWDFSLCLEFYVSVSKREEFTKKNENQHEKKIIIIHLVNVVFLGIILVGWGFSVGVKVSSAFLTFLHFISRSLNILAI